MISHTQYVSPLEVFPSSSPASVEGRVRFAVAKLSAAVQTAAPLTQLS